MPVELLVPRIARRLLAEGFGGRAVRSAPLDDYTVSGIKGNDLLFLFI